MLGASSSMWWVTVSVVRPGRSRDRAFERLEQELAPAQVEPGRRLVESEHRCVGDQAAGEHDPRALALRARRERAERERAGTDRIEELVRPLERAGRDRVDDQDRARRDPRARRRSPAAPDRTAVRAPARRARSGGAARAAAPVRAGRRAPRQRLRSGASARRRRVAASSCRPRWARRFPSARPRRPTSRSRRGSSCERRATCATGRLARNGRPGSARADSRRTGATLE